MTLISMNICPDACWELIIAEQLRQGSAGPQELVLLPTEHDLDYLTLNCCTSLRTLTNLVTCSLRLCFGKKRCIDPQRQTCLCIWYVDNVERYSGCFIVYLDIIYSPLCYCKAAWLIFFHGTQKKGFWFWMNKEKQKGHKSIKVHF